MPVTSLRALLRTLLHRVLPLVAIAAVLTLTAGALAQDAPGLAGSASAPAAGGGAAAAPAGGPRPAAQPDGGLLFYLLPAVVVLWIVMLMMGQRRDGKKKTAMLDSLKKHDRVQTAGGVIGSVVEVKPSVVVLKVDESSNTRITFAKSAIVGILKEDGEPMKESPSGRSS